MSVVELKGGLFVSEAALRLCLLLENLGHALTAKEGKLLVSNGAALTAEQRAQIVELRLHLLTIAGVIAEQELHPPTYSRGDAAH